MGKTKSAQLETGANASQDVHSKSLTSVKDGAITKPSQTTKAKSQEIAKQVAMKSDKAGKKSKKAKKEPTPVPSSESEDDAEASSASSASSDEESEDEAPVPQQAAKTNGVAKVAVKSNAESSDSSDSPDDDEPAPRAAPAAATKAVAGAKAGSESEDDNEEDSSEGTSEGTSEDSSEDESGEEEVAPMAALDTKKVNGKLEKVASKEESSDEESGSEASSSDNSDSSDEEEEEEEEEQAAPAPKKRKVEAEVTPISKKAKTDPGNDDGAKKNLFIGHLSYNVDEEWLTREFEKFGELTRVKVMTDRESGQSRGFGYVEFASAADGVKAQAEMHEVEIDGRAVNVDFSKPKPDQATPRQDRQKSYGDNTSAASDTIFVANLPFDVTEDVVAEEFGKHGSVLGVRLPTDMNSGAPKGFGYVQFGSVEESQEVFSKMAGAMIMGRPIRIDFSTPRPPRDGDSPRGRGGRGGFERGGRGGGRGRGGFDRGGRGGGFDRGRGGRGGSTNRGGVGSFAGQKKKFDG